MHDYVEKIEKRILYGSGKAPKGIADTLKRDGDKMQEWRDVSPVPTESVEQQRLFEWAAWWQGAHPELGMLYHIPNEGKRSKRTGARMKAEGLKKGFPDLCLPVARKGKHGLYIELKRSKGGRVSDRQREWLEKLAAEGYAVAVCYGWENAAETIQNYLGGEAY